VLAHAASHVLPTSDFRRPGLVPGDDVLNIPTHLEYRPNKIDLDSATRGLDQFKKAVKAQLKDWLGAAWRWMEVQQALEVRHLFI
jgi:hypothetical protein